MTPAEIESLIARDDWLRRLARSLVRDPAAADDLVQDAWVASLEREERGRPWLATVLRNGSVRRLRRRANATARDRDAGRMRATEAPPVDEVLADLELRERVVHELAALEEPLRTTVYLRFVTGASLAEVAQQTGVAGSTASERVARGLAQMRRRLDRANGGDRRAWALPLSALARTEEAGQIAAGAASFAGPVAALVGAGALVALAAVAPRVLGGGRAPDGPPEDVTLASAPTDGLDLDAAPELAALSSTGESRDALATSSGAPPAAEANAGAFRITGSFRLEDGTPAAGTTWTIHGTSGNRDLVREHGLPNDWEDLQGTLDGEGRLDVAFDPPRAYQFFLSVGAPEHARAEWRWGSLGPDGTTDIGAIDRERSGSIEGRVLDASGAPLIGQDVWLYAEELENAAFPSVDGREPVRERAAFDPATGTFGIEGLPPGGVRLSAGAGSAGLGSGPVVDVVAGDVVTADVTFTGLDAASQRITVRARSRRFLHLTPDADHVRLAAPDGSSVAPSRVDGAGVARFDAVGEGPFVVIVDDPRFETWSKEDVRPGDTVRARLEGSAAVRLEVRDASGAEVGRFEVAALFDFGSGRTRRVVVHEDGPAPEGGVVSGLTAGDQRLEILAAEGRALLEMDGLVAGETRTMECTLEGAAGISGVVLDPDGTPLAHVEVRLVRPAEESDSPAKRILPPNASANPASVFRWEVARTSTDDHGLFTLAPSPSAGRYLVVAGMLGGINGECPAFDVVSGESSPFVEIVLPRGSDVRGVVREPAGLNLMGWRAVLLRTDAAGLGISRWATTTVEGGGTFGFGRLRPGPVELHLIRPGASINREDLGAENGTLLGQFDLVDGVDLDEQHEFPGPIPARITFRFEASEIDNDEVYVRLLPTGNGMRNEVARASGSLSAVGPALVPPGTYEVEVSGRRWFHLETEPLSIAANETRTVEIEVDLRAGAIEVHRDGAPLANGDVQIQRSGASLMDPHVHFTTDGAGRCTLHLPPGEYRMHEGTRPWDANGPGVTFQWPLPADAEPLVL
ncbi:MAG: sigma-70 family RNA polymerase sigma factor [Planctomycetota bacterium]